MNRHVLGSVVVALAACSSTPNGNPDMAAPPATIVTTVVTPSEGGTLRSADGRFTLTVPPGAVASSVELSVQANATGYTVEPSGLEFAVPVGVDWGLTTTELAALRTPEGDPIPLLWSTSPGRAPALLDNQVMSSGDAPSLRAETTHLSDFEVESKTVFVLVDQPASFEAGISTPGRVFIVVPPWDRKDSGLVDQVLNWISSTEDKVFPTFHVDSYATKADTTYLDVSPINNLTGRDIRSAEVSDMPTLNCSRGGPKRWHVEWSGKIVVEGDAVLKQSLEKTISFSSYPQPMEASCLAYAVLTDVTPKQVKAGTRVTITGKYLLGRNPTEVEWHDKLGLGGRVTATGTDTSISFTFPPNVTPGSVKLETVIDSAVSRMFLTVENIDEPPDMAMPDLATPPDLASAPTDMAMSMGPDLSNPCDRGYLDCTGDGYCETDAKNDVWNCGACGRICPSSGTLSNLCINGTCTPVCDSDHADCDGNGANGCEVNIRSDKNNCNGCGNKCEFPNARATCYEFVCTFIDCSPVEWYGNCDGDTSNGCEQFLGVDEHCGFCTTQCGGGLHCGSTSGITYWCF